VLSSNEELSYLPPIVRRNDSHCPAATPELRVVDRL